MKFVGSTQAALVALVSAGLAQAQFLVNELSFGMSGK
jgi:hypothetical protein